MTFGLCRAIGELEEAIWGDHGHTVDEDVGAGEARVEESLLFSSSSEELMAENKEEKECSGYDLDATHCSGKRMTKLVCFKPRCRWFVACSWILKLRQNIYTVKVALFYSSSEPELFMTVNYSINAEEYGHASTLVQSFQNQ